jgi:hypothetical protein
MAELPWTEEPEQVLTHLVDWLDKRIKNSSEIT